MVFVSPCHVRLVILGSSTASLFERPCGTGERGALQQLEACCASSSWEEDLALSWGNGAGPRVPLGALPAGVRSGGRAPCVAAGEAG